MRRLRDVVLVVLAGGTVTAMAVALLVPQIRTVLTAGEAAPLEAIDLDPLPQRSVVLAADGSLLAVLYREENRESVPLSQVPQPVIDTVLAVEDQSFYSHGGLDVRAATRALFTNVAAGDVRQGGSTLTQQVVKNTLLSPRQDLQRKSREAVLALRLEEEMTKDQILERYLNTVYFGNGAYGVQAAAETYFGVGAADLDQGQAAFLAGLIRNPVGYDPFLYPDLARERRDQVVDRLLGVGQLDQLGADRIRSTPIPTGRASTPPRPKDYFVEEVTRLLLADPRLGETQSDRYNAIFRGGLMIKTTLDPRLQGLAEEAVASTLPDTAGQFSAAVVTVEPGTGAVRAMVGGPGFEQAKYNIATQGTGRQPGSSFKPYVLATALEQGLSPNDTINGSGPCRLETPLLDKPYEVDNYEGSRGGVMSVASATQSSVNCAYARLGLIVGPDQVAQTAKRMGITTPLPPLPSIALGALEVLPIDMAGAFATFASDGVHFDPYLVEEVLDQDGELVLEGRAKGRRAISERTARLATEVLEGVVKAGTGTRARLPGRPVAGKTGTTQSYADAWFVGFAPQLSTAVWMGSPRGRVPMTKVGGTRRVSGGSYPARIWRAFMEPALADLPVVDFAPAPAAGAGTYLSLPGEPLPTPPTEPEVQPVIPDTTAPQGTAPTTAPTRTSLLPRIIIRHQRPRPTTTTTTPTTEPPPPTTTTTTEPPPTTTTSISAISGLP